MPITRLNHVLSTILKHDRKQNSYKIALLRSINDVVLSFPALTAPSVAIPLRVLAEFWVAYYFPFVDPSAPILQGVRATRNGVVASDMSFREALTQFRASWEAMTHGQSRPADGFFLINELRLARKRTLYPGAFIAAYDKAIGAIAKAIEKPVRYAGEGEYGVFAAPERFGALQGVQAIPGTTPHDRCIVVSAALCSAFRELSLWIEALCIHEWCLLTERLTGEKRGKVYELLTDRPDNRRPLTWERNEVDLLLMEGALFECPWTGERIVHGVAYDLDHIVPLAVYPINELWNLVPANPDFNMHQKRDRLPSAGRLQVAVPRLTRAYTSYEHSPQLAEALHEDAAMRFAPLSGQATPEEVTSAVIGFVSEIAQSRNLAQFSGVMTTYNKLVRDRIPEIIASEGRQYAIEVMEDEEYRQALRGKLVEEAREASEATGDKLVSELADLYEVIDALLTANQLDETAVRSVQQERRAARGGFQKRLKLLWADDR